MTRDEFTGLEQLATELQNEIYGGLYAYAIAAGFEGYDLADSSDTTVIHVPKDSPVTPEKLVRYLEWTQPDRLLRLLARVAELTGRVEGLEGALRPFVAHYDPDWMDAWSDDVQMSKLEEWQHHIEHTRTDLKGQAWCGQNCADEWSYADLDHAAYSLLNGDRIQPCPACLAAVQAIFADTPAPLPEGTTAAADSYPEHPDPVVQPVSEAERRES